MAGHAGCLDTACWQQPQSITEKEAFVLAAFINSDYEHLLYCSRFLIVFYANFSRTKSPALSGHQPSHLVSLLDVVVDGYGKSPLIIIVVIVEVVQQLPAHELGAGDVLVEPVQ